MESRQMNLNSVLSVSYFHNPSMTVSEKLAYFVISM